MAETRSISICDKCGGHGVLWGGRGGADLGCENCDGEGMLYDDEEDD